MTQPHPTIGRAVWVLRYLLKEIRIAFFGWR